MTVARVRPIAGLPLAGQLDGTEIIPGVQQGAAVGVSAGKLADLAASKVLLPQLLDVSRITLANAAKLIGRSISFDPTVDNAPAINAVLVKAASSKWTIDGERRRVSVATIVRMTGAIIENFELIDIAPNASVDRRVVYGEHLDGFAIRELRVYRNGDGTNGVGPNTNVLSQNPAAVFLDDCKNFLVSGVEVSGDNQGSGLEIVYSSDFDVVRPYVHDMKFNAPGLVDDAIQGISILGCKRWTLQYPRVQRLLGNPSNASIAGRYQNPTGAFVPIYTRGIAIGSCEDFTILVPRVSDVDQGIDITGGINKRFTVLGGALEDLGTWGVKCANIPQMGRVLGVTVSRAGFGGFIASPPAPSPPGLPFDLTFRDCIAIDIGNLYWPTNGTFGFGVYRNDANPGSPKTVRFRNCHHYETRAVPAGTDVRAKFGFYNEVIYTDGEGITADGDCTSVGATIAASQGMHELVTRLGLSASVTVTSGTGGLAILWTLELADSMNCHAANQREWVAPRAGRYRVEAGVQWGSSPTGRRTILVRLNGGAVLAQADAAPVSSGNMYMSIPPATVHLAKGDQIRVEVDQNSGGDIAVSAAGSFFNVFAA